VQLISYSELIIDCSEDRSDPETEVKQNTFWQSW